MMHVVPEHTSGNAQALPEQHGSPAFAPHATHAVPLQMAFTSHMFAGQHGLLGEPHETHALPSHTNPGPHELAEQHGCDPPPHGTQLPDRQANPEMHRPPSQHGCDEAPHAAVVMHMPPEHVLPGMQLNPPQHA
jgi:hypothetical protein